MAKNKDQLIPVQRQVTRDGRTFMTTVYVKPRHAKTSKDKTIEIPEWRFTSAKGFQDEFERINSMRDKTARQYLKDQLLDHVEKEMGVKYDKLPETAERASVRNSLRGFSAAKKHLSEGKGYAIKKKEKKPTKRPNKVKKETQKTEQKRKKLPTKVLEAYDEGTNLQKAIALLTGVMPEDKKSADFLAERIANGEMGIINPAGRASSPLEGNMHFETEVDKLVLRRGGNPVDRLRSRGLVDGVSVDLQYSGFLAARNIPGGSDPNQKLNDTKFQKALRTHLRTAGGEYSAMSRPSKTPELDKLFDDVSADFSDSLKLSAEVNSLSMQKSDAYLTTNEIVSDLSNSGNIPPLEATNVELTRRRNVNNYVADLTKSLDKDLGEVSYADIAKEQKEMRDILESGDTDKIWDAFDMDTVLTGEETEAMAGRAFTAVRENRSYVGSNIIGGENNFMLNAWLMTQADEDTEGYNSTVVEMNKKLYVGMRDALRENPEIEERITPDGSPVLNLENRRPTIHGLKRALDEGRISREDVITIMKPGFENMDTAPGETGSSGREGSMSELLSNSSQWETRNPFVEMDNSPLIDPTRAPDHEVINNFDTVGMGMLIDPFGDMRARSNRVNMNLSDERVFKASTSKEEAGRIANEQNERIDKVKQNINETLSDKERYRTAFKYAVYSNLPLVSQGNSSTGTAKQRQKFQETVGGQEFEFPDDDFIDDPRIQFEDKLRYALKLAAAPKNRVEKLKKDMMNEIARKNDMPEYDPPKRTKQQRIDAARNDLSRRVEGKNEDDIRRALTEESFEDSVLPDASDLTKTTVKTSIGAVSDSTLKSMTKSVKDSHDITEHSTFIPEVRGAYEIKSSANDEAYEAKKSEIGGKTVELYHGTSFATTQKILGESGGFKVFEGGTGIKSGSMMGYGIYLADKSSKSAQYISNTGFGRSSDRGVLFVCEATLGKVDTFDRNKHAGASHKDKDYDTVEALSGVGNTLVNAEWLVKDADQARPKYMIDYERKQR